MNSIQDWHVLDEIASTRKKINISKIEYVAQMLRIAEIAYAIAHADGYYHEDLPTDIEIEYLTEAKYAIDNPKRSIEISHEDWVKIKKMVGWSYGEEEDLEKKTSPDIISAANLKVHQKMKRYMKNTVMEFAIKLYNQLEECSFLNNTDKSTLINAVREKNEGDLDMSNEKIIKVKYFPNSENLTVTPIQFTEKGDWIDLRAAENIAIQKGDFAYIPLGVGMILPKGYEALIALRSSAFKNWGIIQPNSPAVIDNSYNGDTDQWRLVAYATRDTTIKFNERICQFRLLKNQEKLPIVSVEKLNDLSRGGIGSTGIS